MNKELNIFTLRMLRDQYEAEHMDTEVEALDAAIKAMEQPEIIRCKDCSRWCICHRSDDWYCADAERRKDGSDR